MEADPLKEETMGLRINQNVAAMNSYRNLSVTEGQMSKSLEKLSSGFRINRAADDAAGLSISEHLRSQVGGFKVASRNAQDGVSLIQTAEGSLNEVHALLQRMRDLAVQAANGTNDTASGSAAQAEFDAAASEIDRIGGATAYGSLSLLATDTTFTFQVGADGATINQIAASISGISSSALSVSGVGISTTASAISAIASLDAAISFVSAERSGLGAIQNRLEHTVANLGVAVENLSAAESRIRDTDMAEEMVAFTRNQILSQAGTSMLGQANQMPQSVLSLLRG
jgi:flagellin